MLALDLFNTKYEQDLREGAVDDLEARRIDTLNDRMQDLLSRAREPAYQANPGALAALKKQFQQVKDERDSYYKVREAGIPGNVPVEKIPGKEDLLKGRGRTYYEDEVNEDDVEDFIKAGGKITYGKPQKGPRRPGMSLASRHIGGGNDRMKPSRSGRAANTQGKPVVSVEDSEKKNSETGPLDQKLQRLKVQARRQFPRAHTDDEALVLKLLDKETQDDQANRRTDARQDAELRKNFALDREQDDDIDNLQAQASVKEHGGGIGPRQRWQDLMPEQYNDDEDYEDENDRDTELRSGDYVRDTMDGESGEVFRMQGDPYERRVRILDRGGKGWYIEPSRLTRVDPTDPDVQRYFGKQRQRDMDEGWKSTLGGAALAGAMAVGAGGAQARVAGDNVDNPDVNRLTGKPNVAQTVQADQAKPTAPSGYSKAYLQSVVDGSHPRPMIGKEKAQELLNQLREQGVAEAANVNPQFINAQITKILAGEARRMTNAPMAQLLAPVMKEYGLTLQQIDSMVPGGLKKAAAGYGIMMKEGWSERALSQRTGTPRTPYSVFIKGKKWKDFENDDHAEAVANKLRAKFKADGRDPSVITVAPTDMTEGLKSTLAGAALAGAMALGGAGAAQAQSASSGLPNATTIIQQIQAGKIQNQNDLSAALGDNQSIRRFVFKQLQAKAGLPGHGADSVINALGKKGTAGAQQPAKSAGQSGVIIQRPTDNFEGKIKEDQDSSGVERAILNRIMVAHTDLLMKFGPDKVMQAAEEVAYNVGDVDEIGTSDVSAYVAQVKQILGATP
jgi:hypothetical protein